MSKSRRLTSTFFPITFITFTFTTFTFAFITFTFITFIIFITFITVFSLISAPGAFAIEKISCPFSLQLAPPFEL